MEPLISAWFNHKIFGFKMSLHLHTEVLQWADAKRLYVILWGENKPLGSNFKGKNQGQELLYSPLLALFHAGVSVQFNEF